MAANKQNKGGKTGAGKPSLDDEIWAQHFKAHFVTEGSFVRGKDLSGNPCIGVVWYSIMGCHHLEIILPGEARKNLHVNRADMVVIEDQDMTPEELAFATAERRLLKSMAQWYELTAGMRGCPVDREKLLAVLKDSGGGPLQPAERPLPQFDFSAMTAEGRAKGK